METREPTQQETIDRKALSRLSSGARDEEKNLRLARLEQEGEEWALGVLRSVVEAVDIADWDYVQRENLAEEAGNVNLPQPDQIEPHSAHQLLRRLSSLRIQANAITRQAERRARLLDDALESIMGQWKALTVETTEWKAEASAAAVLEPLRKERSRAKAHAAFCGRCLDSIKDTILELHWILENWDRFN